MVVNNAWIRIQTDSYKWYAVRLMAIDDIC